MEATGRFVSVLILIFLLLSHVKRHGFSPPGSLMIKLKIMSKSRKAKPAYGPGNLSTLVGVGGGAGLAWSRC